MSIADHINALVNNHGFTLVPSLSTTDVTSRLLALNVDTLDGVSDFYRICNGLCGSHYSMTFLSLESLSSNVFDGWPFLGELGLLPVVDANDSNPLCVITRGPLRGLVAHIFHDGDTCLRFASFADLLEGLANVTSCWDAYHSEQVRTLPPHQRENANDHRITTLLEEADPDDRDENSMRLRFAINLCHDSEEERIARIMELGDEYVREAALQRLASIDSDAARTIVENDRRQFSAFVKQLRKRGSEEKVRRLNLRMLFAARHDVDFDERIARLLK